MKAVTLTQPWATLVAIGAKRIETRSWRPSIPSGGQRLAIHAAKGWRPNDVQFAYELHSRGILTTLPGALPLGAIVAIARLNSVVSVETLTCGGLRGPKAERWSPLTDIERELGDYSDGRFAWLLDDVVPVDPPVPARGALGLWAVAVPL